jgi:hypothetical protein
MSNHGKKGTNREGVNIDETQTKIDMGKLITVAGELLIPKNMTVGSNNPQFIKNAAFHSSPSFIHTLLYPHIISSLLKYFVSFN